MRSYQNLMGEAKEICMDKLFAERRQHPRYAVHMPVDYHVSQKGRIARAGSGFSLDMSSSGLSFRSRGVLPEGAHIEMVIDWPVKYADVYPVDLLVTGFVVRSDTHQTAVRITSRKFRVAEAPTEPIRASA